MILVKDVDLWDFQESKRKIEKESQGSLFCRDDDDDSDGGGGGGKMLFAWNLR